MKSLYEYSEIISRNSSHIRDEYGVESLCIFGSVATGSQHESSDVDLCVEMPPKMLMLIKLKQYLESILGSAVDLVRVHSNMNPYLKQEIAAHGVYVIR